MEKYCSCDQACQFSALYGTHWRSYLENLIINDKFINKQSSILYASKDVSRRKNYFIARFNCLITLKKIKTEAATWGAEAVTGGVL